MIYASAPGKINLFFEVGPLRPDGFHSVVSLYQSLAIRQRVGVEPAEHWEVSTTGDLPREQLDLVPVGEENLVVLAAKALANHVGISNPQPMRFETFKQVPVAAGLAGGSADAAAALVALNEAWCLGLETQDLMKPAAKVGSDVPFALMGGTALGLDTGIELEQLEPLSTTDVVLGVSPFGLSTAKVFAKFDELYRAGDISLTGAQLKDQLRAESLQLGKNSLKPAAISLRPELADLFARLPREFSLSGSGPTVYLATTDSLQADEAQRQLSDLGLFVIRTTTAQTGATLES